MVSLNAIMREWDRTTNPMDKGYAWENAVKQYLRNSAHPPKGHTQYKELMKYAINNPDVQNGLWVFNKKEDRLFRKVDGRLVPFITLIF